MKLSEYEIKYQPRLTLKGQVMVDFISELPKKLAHPVESLVEGWWTLNVDGESKASGSEVGLILQSPTGELSEQDIRLDFSASNNETEYEIVLAGLGLALTLATIKLEICSDSQLIVEKIHKEYKAKDECMAHYLTMVEDRLKKLDE